MRKMVQPPRVVEAKLDNLPSDAPREEKQMLLWMLGRGNYPKWKYKVRKVVNSEVEVQGDVNVTARSANIGGGTDDDIDMSVIDLKSLLSVENVRNSHDYLTTLLPPKSYRPVPTSAELKKSFESNLYFLSDEEIFAIHQSIILGKALLISGPPGVGKTEAGRQIAMAMGLNVKNTLQYDQLFCTPDIGTGEAIYEWNDAKRLLDLQILNGALTAHGHRIDGDQVTTMYKEVAANAYGLRYLEIRKLLRACLIPYRTVTLIDEADKPYPTFDNELLDIIGAFRYEIPEYGALGKSLGHAQDDPNNPFFVLTVNDSTSGGRDLSPMLVSRCTPLFLNYLNPALEQKVIMSKCNLDATSAGRMAQFFYRIRVDLKLRLPPSTREVIATAQGLTKTGVEVTDFNLLTYNCHWLKNRLDYEQVRAKYITKDTAGRDVWRASL